MSDIIVFRENYWPRAGQSRKKQIIMQKYCRIGVMRRFDEWRPGKKIISATPDRGISSWDHVPTYYELAVVYE